MNTLKRAILTALALVTLGGAGATAAAAAEGPCSEGYALVESVGGPLCVNPIYLDGTWQDDPATCEHGYYQGSCVTPPAPEPIVAALTNDDEWHQPPSPALGWFCKHGKWKIVNTGELPVHLDYDVGADVDLAVGASTYAPAEANSAVPTAAGFTDWDVVMYRPEGCGYVPPTTTSTTTSTTSTTTPPTTEPVDTTPNTTTTVPATTTTAPQIVSTTTTAVPTSSSVAPSTTQPAPTTSPVSTLPVATTVPPNPTPPTNLPVTGGSSTPQIVVVSIVAGLIGLVMLRLARPKT